MATTGKKINELDLISDLTNETVLPAVRIQNQSISSTATKVTVELLKTFIQNDTVIKPTIRTNLTTTNATIGLVMENTIYQYGVLESLTIDGFQTSYLESIIYFETGSSFTLTFEDAVWAANNEPTFEANTPYILHIKNGIVSVEGLGSGGGEDPTALVEITATSGTVSLKSGGMYIMTISGNTVFQLPTPEDDMLLNQILLQLRITTSVTVDWGTSKYFTDSPITEAGYYNMIWEYDAIQKAWVVGQLTKLDS